eukprot:CAMPEP_0116141438 /NCGR_PEP_ID=MMETSP0329-20121206/14383_1 /TAXON_ID=697910 /ORGANISM="Pseudo-nitzschia arenysensis, Strain B593" /LENGTH=700 /DNA_ID=CAMNT_0003636623 /DNA_START=158 /DNA_END=2260 /DNA_ORIENTATION=-
MLFEAFLNGFAILSTIVATLRAGSRVLYISEHGAIGLVDGPRIAPPRIDSNSIVGSESRSGNSTDTTTAIGDEILSKDPYNPALYELAENFKQCVMISSSKALDSSLHGCKNLVRDCQIKDIPPMPTTAIETQSSSDEGDSSSSFLQRRFRGIRSRIRSLTGGQSQKQKRKDPFMNKAYTLGYAHYSPKTFRENDKESKNDPSADSSSQFESPLDFGRATEADYYYHAVSPSPDKATKRRRLAQLKSYGPETFGDLRSSVFGISEDEYLQSVLGTMVSFQSNSKGAARAGGIFFFTSDGAYMIKTIPNREKKTLLKILPEYYDHMKRNGRKSLLTRFCGMYGITIEEEDAAKTVEAKDTKSQGDILGSLSDLEDGASSFAPTGKEYTFVVMNAVFPAEASSFVSERFDLKGSTVGREVSREELESKGKMAVLKDLDLSREVDLVRSKQRQLEEEEELAFRTMNHGRKLWWGRPKSGSVIVSRRRRKKEDPSGFTIGATAKAALLSQLRKDVKFLTRCQVMDYSLLVGVVNTDNVDSGGGGKSGALTPEVIESIQEQNKVLEVLEGTEQRKRRLPKLDSALMHTLTTPVRLMLSPPIYIARKTWNTLQLTLNSIVTAPMPYYGSDQCGVYGGKLSVLHGKRKGDRAVYYLGLIDFLQPWTTRKVMERKLKGLAGYDTNAISAVTPEEYASRFLEFLDKHIS